MAANGGANSPAPPDDFSASIGRLQDTAKWIVGILGAIAAILVAGTQVSKIGQLSAHDARFVVALVAGAAALLCIAVIIAMATRVLVLPPVSLPQLESLEQHSPGSDEIRFVSDAGLTAGLGSIAALNTAFDNAVTAQAAAVQGANVPLAQQQNELVDYYGQVIHQLLLGVKARRATRRFWHTVLTLFIAGLGTAVAIAIFAWATNPPAATIGVVGAPSEALLVLTPGGQTALSKQLGASCVTAPVLVEVLGASKGEFDVMTVGTAHCAAVRLTLDDPTVGVLQPAASQAVSVPAGTPGVAVTPTRSP